MKRLIIVLVLLAVVSTVCTTSVLYVGYSMKELNQSMEKTIELAKQEDMKNANRQLLRTAHLWEKHRTILMMYIEQDLLDEMDNQLALLKALVLYHEEEFLPQAMLCISFMEEIQQRESISSRSWF